jgi:hypothetical protein
MPAWPQRRDCGTFLDQMGKRLHKQMESLLNPAKHEAASRGAAFGRSDLRCGFAVRRMDDDVSVPVEPVNGLIRPCAQSTGLQICLVGASSSALSTASSLSLLPKVRLVRGAVPAGAGKVAFDRLTSTHVFCQCTDRRWPCGLLRLRSTSAHGFDMQLAAFVFDYDGTLARQGHVEDSSHEALRPPKAPGRQIPACDFGDRIPFGTWLSTLHRRRRGRARAIAASLFARRSRKTPLIRGGGEASAASR